jgi:hypothetical protein
VTHKRKEKLDIATCHYKKKKKEKFALATLNLNSNPIIKEIR